jgi:hypothetical protein
MDSFVDFISSWTFMIIMAVLLASLIGVLLFLRTRRPDACHAPARRAAPSYWAALKRPCPLDQSPTTASSETVRLSRQTCNRTFCPAGVAVIRLMS